ncbi:MAG: ATP-binding protein [Treponema sp.]|nr:ATP-binding protein [Treponema sp.]
MSILGIINSDPEIRQSIEFTFKNKNDQDLLFLIQNDEIIEFIKYTMPELVVINFSDPVIKIDKIIRQIKNDRLIFNFGIIGIFDSSKRREEELLEKYKSINVLAMLDNYCIRSHLLKSIEIIEQNYQLIFQKEFTKTFLEGACGKFIIDNDVRAVPLYASIGATILSQRGLINSDRKMHLQLALIELIMNAIEHGNCGISYEEKTKSMEEGVSSLDLITEKCKDPAVKKKKVYFNWDIKPDKTTFVIRDEGKGFDVKSLLKEIKNQDNFSLHGRGIKMAKKLSSKLRYNDKGNQATMVVNHDKLIENDVPAGFKQEKVIKVRKGQVVIKEGDSSDYLYYISSGTFEVLHNGAKVGSLSAHDIFMGEMSFLLNQRRSATIKATSAGKLIQMTQKTFINIIREYPHYGIFLSKLLAKRIVRSNEQAASKKR